MTWTVHDAVTAGSTGRHEVAPAGGSAVRETNAGQSSWTYDAAEIASDFPVLPTAIDITVRQLGAGGYAGDPATLQFNLT